MQPVAVCLLLVVIAGVVAGAPGFDERIIGGTAVNPDPNGASTQFPYMVSIEDDRNHFCGGFIYNPKWIVTTASCMENKVISKLTVVAGQVNLIDLEPMTEQRVSVFRVIPYETYNNVTKKDDIALVEISDQKGFDLTKTEIRDLIKFNEVFTDPPDSSFTPIGTFMGWGATVLGGGFSPRLRFAEVTMVENDPVCPPYAQEEFTISSMICAKSLPGISPCTLDEGAPLVQTYTPNGGDEVTRVVGILSKYSPTCNPTESSIFTRLSVYYAWLYRTAGEQVYTIA